MSVFMYVCLSPVKKKKLFLLFLTFNFNDNVAWSCVLSKRKKGNQLICGCFNSVGFYDHDTKDPL